MATASGKGKRLTPEEIARYAYGAGFRGQALIIAVAVALAESGGVVNAHNPKGEDSRGLWQINVAPNVRKNKWGDLSDPAVNARAAFEVSGQGRNFNPWTTYAGSTAAGRASSHSKHLSAATAAAGRVEKNPGPVSAHSTSAAPVAAADKPLPPDASPKQIREWIAKNAPEIEWMLSNEEIMGAVVDWVQEKEPGERLHDRLRDTDYFRTHGPSSRALDKLIGTDSAEAGRAIGRAKNTVQSIFERNGIAVDEAQLGEAAKKALREGWLNLDSGQIADPAKTGDFTAFLLRLGQDPGEMRDGVFTDKESGRKAFYGPNQEAGTASRAEIEKHAAAGDVIKSHKMPDGRTAWYIEGKNIDETSNALPAGEASFDADGVQAIARQYLVPITRRDAEDWALRMMEGNASEESLKSWLGNLAKARYATQPDMLAAIEQGMTPSQFFAGHKATIAQILELDDTQIDFMDPKWMDAIEVLDEKGGRRAPTLGEAADWARKRPEFANTRSYKSKTSEYSLGLSEFFGRVA